MNLKPPKSAFGRFILADNEQGPVHSSGAALRSGRCQGQQSRQRALIDPTRQPRLPDELIRIKALPSLIDEY